MANVTVTTTVNYDSASISSLLNGENITINSGSLTINSDVRWNQQAAVFGNITVSNNANGSLFVDGTTVWELPFSASTGNIPTQAALGSNGVTGGTSGATGELLRVWATGSLTPAAAGGAMPTTGWIKLRTKTGTFTSGEIVTLPGGATITISSGGKRSWLHIVGAQLSTVSSGGQPYTSLNFIGDWYELGYTNGTDDQTFQFPVADNCPAIWIETAPGSNTYESWLCGGDRWGTVTQYIPTSDNRGKFFGINTTTGVITIARRASNPCGLKPASGCRVVVGNLILSNSTSADWTANTMISTTNSRYRLSTATCPVTWSKVTSNWSFTASPIFPMTVTDCSISLSCVFGGTFTRVAIGLCGALETSGATTNLRYTSTVLTDVRYGVFAHGYQAGMNFINCSNVTMTRVRLDSFGSTGSTTRLAGQYLIWVNGCNSFTISNCQVIGTGFLFQNSSSISMKDTQYCDLMIGTTTSTGGLNLAQINTVTNFFFDGLTAFDSLPNLHPYSGLFNFTAVKEVMILNIGSVSTPYSTTGTIASYKPNALFVIYLTENMFIQRVYCTDCTYAIYAPNSAISRTNTFINVHSNATNSTGLTFVGVVQKGCRWAADYATGVYDFFWQEAFTSSTVGRIVASFFPSLGTALTAGQYYSSNNGLQQIGDYIELTMDYFAIGHTGFSSVSSMPSGVSVTFQYDIGSGWNGAWLAATTANVTGISINPAVGIKLKVRATATANYPTISLFTFTTVTNSTDYLRQYNLAPIKLILTGVIPGTEVRAYVGENPATSTEIDGVESCDSSTVILNHYNAGQSGYIVLVSLSYQDLVIPITYSSSAVSIPVFQQKDRQYLNP